MNRRSIAQRQRRERERRERELQEFSNRRQESAQQITLARSSVNQFLHHEAQMPARYITPPTTQDATGNPVRPLAPAPPIQDDRGKLILAYNVAVFLVHPASQQLPTPPPTNMIGMTFFSSISTY